MSLSVELQGVVKRFGGNAALDSVDLGVEPGRIHAVIGPNGAGKSTLFGAIAGELALDAGTIRLDGRDITGVSAPKRVGLGIGRVFQVARLFPSMTVLDNVAGAVLARTGSSIAFWSSRGVRRARAEAAGLLEELRLADLAHRRAGSLSQGDRKRLEIAMVLALDSQVLLLDEPTAGMSPEETEATTDLVRRLWSERSITVLITEHDMNVVFGLAHQVTVMYRGGVLCTGDPEEIRKRPDVAEVYLGGAV